jgi:raffinose/stachyose/melibiose transport system permease protein
MTDAPIVPSAYFSIKKRKIPFLTGIGNSISFIVLVSYFFMVVYPLFWMIMSSLKSTSEIYSNPWGLPSKLLFQNYLDAWHQGISSYFFNSLFVTVITCVLTVLLSSIGAYAVSRFNFKGKKIAFILIITGLMFSPQVSLIPLYQFMQSTGLYNTYWALILPYVAYRIPLTVLLIRAHFLSIPKEFEEAAYLDGCNSLGVFFRVIIPLSKPILLTAAVLTAYFSWNEFMFAMIFINDDSLKTIPIGLLAFQGAFNTNWGVLLAGLTISAAPMIIFFIFVQKYFVKGISAGGVKG